MKNFYKLILVVLFGANLLTAGDGLSQAHLVSTTPSPNSDNVTPNTSLVFTFDSTIVKHSIKPNTVTLKQIKPTKQKIKGNFVLSDNVLTFMPSALLDKGIYKIKVKSIKLLKEGEDKPEIKTSWQKFVAWLCGLFYDDIANCPLCQFVCYDSNSIKTKPIHYTFEVNDDAPTVTQLIANTILIELSEYNNSTQLQITATYDDNSSEDVTQKATYTCSDSSVVDADKGSITTNTEGSATIGVEYGTKTVNVKVEVYEMIEGHLLPHEPDSPDDTLLGVDENDNGVRDEVERWIYKDMPTYHHPEIERVIAMQQAEAYQTALSNSENIGDIPISKIRRGIHCWAYYSHSKKLPLDSAVSKFGANLKDEVFNTKERLKTYFLFNKNLGIRGFTSMPRSITNCNTNIDLIL